MRVQCVRRGVAAACLTVVAGLGATSACGSGAGAGGDDPGGGGPEPGVNAPAATAGGGSAEGDSGGGDGGGTDSGGAADGDPGVPGLQPPPEDSEYPDSIDAGLDGSIGGISDPSPTSCPTPGPTEYPWCLDTLSPTDESEQPPVADPTSGDTQPPAEDPAGPTDGAALSPEPS